MKCGEELIKDGNQSYLWSALSLGSQKTQIYI